MTSPGGDELATTLARPPRGRRRAAYSAATRRSLVEAAERLFAEHGYAATSLDAIVAEAEVTKGALYHHYSGKQAVFEAVFDRVEDAGARSVQEAIAGIEDPWEKALAGLRAFIAVVRQPAYRRIVLQDGPSVVGYDRIREQEARSTFSYVLDIARAVLSAGDWQVDAAMERTFAQIFFGALSSSGASVATAADPEAAAERVELAVAFMLSGLGALADQGAPMPGLPSAED